MIRPEQNSGFDLDYQKLYHSLNNYCDSLEDDNKHWKAFARWLAEELFNWSLSPEEWEGLQKEFEELTEKEDFPIKETKEGKENERN